MRPFHALCSLVLLSLCAAPAYAQLTYALDNTVLAIDVVLDSDRVNIPWEIILDPEDRIWMTDGPLITRWDPTTDVLDTLLNRGSGNGLGMALHPDFPEVPEVFAVFDTSIYYGGGQLCEVSRFTYDLIEDTLIDEQLLLTYPHSGEHGGGRLLFDTTGHVLLTTADYWQPDDTLFYNRGKTLRFATDGSAPPDNPRPDYSWSWGHRNPQGLAMLPNGGIVNSEHGQATNEINLILPGRNHGWFAFDGAQCTNIFPDSCTSPTFENTLPLAEFMQPPSGAEFYASSEIPEFENKLITCILWQRGLKLFTFNAGYDSIITQEYLSGGAFDDLGRIRDIAIRSDGTFYLITNDRQDARIRWVHAALSTGVSVQDRDREIIWPNPTTGAVHITAVQGTSVEVLDPLGRPVRPPASHGKDGVTIDLAGLVSGLYLLRVTSPRMVTFHRVLKR